MTMYKTQYCQDGITYEICDTYEVHKRLVTEHSYLKQYLMEKLNTEATVEEPPSTEETNIQKEHDLPYTAIEQPIAHDENDLPYTAIEQPIAYVSNNFVWDRRLTKLLPHAYKERCFRFRDPKIKKKLLWIEIVDVFRQHGVTVDPDCLDRKMRNMRRTHRTIKDNNNQSGRGRVNWEYYDIFEDIFVQDRTINFGPTLSSRTPLAPLNEANPSISVQSTQYIHIHYANMHSPLLTLDDRNRVARSVQFRSMHLRTGAHPTFSVSQQPPLCMSNASELNSNVSTISIDYCTRSHNSTYLQSTNYFTDNDLEIEIENETATANSSSASQGLLGTNNSENPGPSTNINSTKKQTHGNRSLYRLRKRQLDIEEKRVEALNLLREKIDESNKIQRERNRLLEVLIRQRTGD